MTITGYNIEKLWIDIVWLIIIRYIIRFIFVIIFNINYKEKYFNKYIRDKYLKIADYISIIVQIVMIIYFISKRIILS